MPFSRFAGIDNITEIRRRGPFRAQERPSARITKSPSPTLYRSQRMVLQYVLKAYFE